MQAASAWVTGNRDLLVRVVGGVVIVAVVVGGYFMWRRHTDNQAGSWLGIAMATFEAPIVPPSNVAGAKQAPNTYPTEQARSEAALAGFREVASRFPSSNA